LEHYLSKNRFKKVRLIIPNEQSIGNPQCSSIADTKYDYGIEGCVDGRIHHIHEAGNENH
jgi:hypothetical protein